MSDFDARVQELEARGEWHELMALLGEYLMTTRAPHERAKAHLKLGCIHEGALNQPALAERHYRAAANKKSIAAHHGLRDLYRRRGDWPSVLDTLQDELPLWPKGRERAEILVAMGDVHADHLGDLEQGRVCWKLAAAESHDCEAAVARLSSSREVR